MWGVNISIAYNCLLQRDSYTDSPCHFYGPLFKTLTVLSAKYMSTRVQGKGLFYLIIHSKWERDMFKEYVKIPSK